MTIDLDALEHQLRSGEKFTNGTRIAGATTIRRLRAELKEARGLLERAEQFIANGVELGFIRMPDADCPDPAHDTQPMIRAFLARNGKGEGK